MKTLFTHLILIINLVIISCSGDVAGGASTEVENPDIRVENSSSISTSSDSKDNSNNLIVSVVDSTKKAMISTNILFFEAAPLAYLKNQNPIGYSTTDQFGNFLIHEKLFDQRDSISVWIYKDQLTAQSTFRKMNIEDSTASITVKNRGLVKGYLSSLANLKSIYFMGTSLKKTLAELDGSRFFSFNGLPKGVQVLIGENTMGQSFILGKWNIQKDTVNLGSLTWDQDYHLLEDFQTPNNIPLINEFSDQSKWTFETTGPIALTPSSLITEGINAWCTRNSSSENLSFQGQIEITAVGDEFSIEIEIPDNFNQVHISGFKFNYTSTADMRFELLDSSHNALMSKISVNAPGGAIETINYQPKTLPIKYLRWRFYQTGQNSIKIDNIAVKGLNMNNLFIQ